MCVCVCVWVCGRRCVVPGRSGGEEKSLLRNRIEKGREKSSAPPQIVHISLIFIIFLAVKKSQFSRKH